MARGQLNLAEIRNQLKRTETTHQDIVQWQASLQAAMFNAITEDDIAAIVQKQVAKAKAGDENAIKFVMSTILGANRPVKINQTLVVTDVETGARLAREGVA